MDIKLVISSKGKSFQKEIKEADVKKFLGKKIGENFKGELIDLTGYEFEITGGSDYAGFPMRKDLPGQGRKKILAVSGIGLHNDEKGIKVRKTVAGNTIHAQTAQINVKVVKEGKEDIFPQKKEAPKEEPKKA
ncbi:MAG TPA: 30S ribosomal protein S6e [Candidatus Nanoarchaeia archaeon]|nr:30S ribosomal protein S6e [Candidatus Nanoarchaeia archaeon]